MSLIRFGTIAHISDLHFTQRLTEKGRTLWKKGGLNSHSSAKAEALAGEFRKLRRWGLDVVIATGDISTDGTVGSLETARRFLESEVIYEYPPRRLIGHGLGIEPKKCLVIPGNHDRYSEGLVPQQTGFTAFEAVFSEPEGGYPFVVGYQLPGQTGQKVPAVLFFVFDSTLPQDADAAKWDRVARGYVRVAECTRLRELRHEITNSKRVTGLNGEVIEVDYENAIRIAVLHHHPVLPKAAKEVDAVDAPRGLAVVRERVAGIVSGWKYDPMLMVNDRLFVGACFDAGIDLVLFGHQHRTYRRRCEPDEYQDCRESNDAHDLYLFCCPATTEYKAEDSGFYLMTFFRDSFRVAPYVWNKTARGNGFSFVEDVAKTLDYEYARNAPWRAYS